MASSNERRTMFQCETCKLFFLSMEVFSRHACVTAEISDVRGVDLSQEITDESIEKDIQKQEEEKNCKWTHASTLMLISEYKERQERVDTGRLKKKRAYEEIAQIMQRNGYPFTDVQCSSRMKTLIRQYKIVKDNNNTSGRPRKTFKYEIELDSLLKDCPNIKPKFVLSSTHSNRDADYDSDESSDEVISKTEKRKAEQGEAEKGTSKRIRKTQVSEVIQYMKKQAEEKKVNQEKEKKKEERHNEKMGMFQQLINALKND